ncbi:HPr family phosphocarrier protein [Faecalicatena sp. AGMB00832]|uniref:HPr family phosphocarrier protein n=1 Tax=Faecalicatena faecalis TaxID=2726362 RepID=A0ABS6CZ15_9FIRM|nr:MULTISPECIES: HPr family phosphocarrier protein [Faecalicatena]MBU3874563.1 HPr family phosphocarrier protein [Faecalicatena faecalis]MCI6464760.1 HPr family phosphocarrier protein [Faecalicatena sp.]MDY5621062.1 HPr family phosphocarrier protein [Lachnospiraceae bacterium]
MPGLTLTANAVRIGFSNVNEIQEFVQTIKDYRGDLDLVQGRMVVDAKSILGICSLNMQEEMELQAYNGDFDELRVKIEKFIR